MQILSQVSQGQKAEVFIALRHFFMRKKCLFCWRMFTTLIFFIQAVSLCKKGKRKENILPVFLSDLNTMCRRGALNEIVSRTGREISKKVVDPFTFEFIFQSHKALSIPSMFGIEDTSKSKNKYCKNFENIIRQEIYIWGHGNICVSRIEFFNSIR